jgi:hypothetical protein
VLVSLTPRDLDVLEALREDRDSSGPGLSKARLEGAAQTRFLDSVLVRLRKHGYRIGIVGGLFQLGEEPDVESDRGGARGDTVPGCGSSSPSASANSTVALSTVPTLFEVAPLSAIDPMLDEAA